jgi:hypothetical protein
LSSCLAEKVTHLCQPFSRRKFQMVYPRTRGAGVSNPRPSIATSPTVTLLLSSRISWILSSHTSALIARLGLDVHALIMLLGGADREARGMVGQNGTAITPTGSRCSCLFGKRNPTSKCVPTLAGFRDLHVGVRRRLVGGLYSHRPKTKSLRKGTIAVSRVGGVDRKQARERHIRE